MDKATEMEFNRLIGVFHGAEYSASTQRLYYESEDMRDFALLIHATNVNIEEAKYHLSFDWLMEVIKKIEKIAPCRVVIDCNLVRIVKPKGKDIKVHTVSKISSLWHAVVQFIQWYNNENKERV